MVKDEKLTIAAASAVDLDVVRALFSEYARSLAFSLEYQGWEEELRALPGKYAPPRGLILLARTGGEAAGCVALRALEEEGACEMKRLYVRPGCRGLGVGAALVERLIDEAKGLGYRVLRLDTVAEQMQSATAMYRALGFREIAPYYESAIAGTVYFELSL